MRVLQINSVCGSGSTGKLAVQISDYLNEQGVENAIAYGFGHCDRPHTYCFGSGIGAHLHSFMSRKLCMQGYGSWFTTGRLIRYIKSFAPTVVHLHNIHGHYLHFPRLFRFLSKRGYPVVWTFHDCWPMTGKCAHFTRVGCDKWKTQCYGCPQLATYPDSTRDRSRQNYAAKKKHFLSVEDMHIVTVSHWLEDTVKSSFLGARDIRCIYNGIDLEAFQPTASTVRQTLGVGDRFMILGVSGQWNNSKGYDQFLSLAQRLDADSVLVLVGVTEAQKAALPANVIGITRTENRQQLAEIYGAADVLVNLSMEETFGLVVAEALACGTPAVVVNSTACPEVVDDATGIVVAPNDGAQLDAALHTIRTKGKIAYSEACVARAHTAFTNERMQAQYYALYSEWEKQQ